jgi:HEAT repeat protein
LAIRASSSKQIAALVADLSAASAVTREAAVARLHVMGARAVEPLLALASTSDDPAARTAALRTLEGIADIRALPVALQALSETGADASVGIAAAGVARVFVRGARGASAVDGLTAVALDQSRLETVRVAALRALRDLERSTVAPLLATLAADANAAVRAAVAGSRMGERAADPGSLLRRAADEELPADPAALRHALAQAGNRAALAALLRIIERVREREAAEPAPGRAGWTSARAAAHLALANRGSRLAVYDLRESIDAAATPLPVEFLAALSIIGDVSCLEAIAAAHARARDGWWRGHLADAFRAIVAREKLTRRHAAIRKIEKRWPQTLLDVWAGKAGRAG